LYKEIGTLLDFYIGKKSDQKEWEKKNRRIRMTHRKGICKGELEARWSRGSRKKIKRDRERLSNKKNASIKEKEIGKGKKMAAFFNTTFEGKSLTVNRNRGNNSERGEKSADRRRPLL